MMVLWSSGPDDEPAPAVVTRVGNKTLSLAVMQPSMASLDPRDGVRHRSDPDVKVADLEDSGVWDYIEQEL